MGVTANIDGVGDFLQQQIEKRIRVLIYRLNYVGVVCVNKARNDGSYKDQTGNLRSSIGYVILREGIIIEGSGFDKNEGGEKGDVYIKGIAAGYPHGIVLIVVAGMNYASYVEALNYDVLSSAELLAEKLVPQLLKQLGFVA